MRLDAVELAGLDQGGEDRSILRPGLVASKEAVLSARCDGADGPFDAVIIHLDAPVCEEQDQPVPVFGDVFASPVRDLAETWARA